MKLLGPARVITRDTSTPFLAQGGVVYDDKTILAVGGFDDLKAAYPQAELMPAGGGVIMPALINTHEHIYSAFARGLSLNNYSPQNFDDILAGMWWRIDRSLTVEDSRYSAWAAYLDCIRNGVTTIFDHHASYGGVSGSLFAIGEVSEQLGLRSCLCFEVSDRNGEAAMREAVAENEAFMKHAAARPALAGMMGYHAAFTLSNTTLDYAKSRTPDGCGAHIHVAEGPNDQVRSLADHGKRIVPRLQAHGLLGKQSIAVHCIHVEDEEMNMLAVSGTMVVHNPESNMGNAVGCQPMQALFDKGILLGLGTDAYTHDMLESYKVANLIHKHQSGDPNAAWGAVPTMLFDHNAQIAARYFPETLGVLKPGAAADIIVLDYDPPTPMDGSNVNGHILFGMNGFNVNTTISAGRTLMQNRVILGIDEAEIREKCRRQAAALWAKL
jgi:putative selenium metabolism protein SsnA